VKCETITDALIPSDSRIDRVHFELDVAKLLQKCQCVKMFFSALQPDRKYLNYVSVCFCLSIFVCLSVCEQALVYLKSCK